MACCTKKAPLSRDTSSYMTVFFSPTASCWSLSTCDLFIRAWPSMNRSTTFWRFVSGSIFSMSAPHRGQSLKRDIHALIQKVTKHLEYQHSWRIKGMFLAEIWETVHYVYSNVSMYTCKGLALSAYLQYTWEQGTHLLLSYRSAWHIMQLKGPSLNVSESYPKGHFGDMVADSPDSCFALTSCPDWCFVWLSPLFFKEASSGRAALTKGQTGVISILISTLYQKH